MTKLGGRRTRQTLWALAYPIAAPKTPRVLYKITGVSDWQLLNSTAVEWTDAPGSTMIVAWRLGGSISPKSGHFGVVSQGELTPLPSPLAALHFLVGIAW